MKFKRPSGTSQGVLIEKPSWFIKIWEDQNPEVYGIGECSPLHWLSVEPMEKMDIKLDEVCKEIDFYSTNLHQKLIDYPSIRFGLEMAMLELYNKTKGIFFDSPFTKGDDYIIINGLIWMGDKKNMLKQVEQKLNAGFKCIKLKIGAIDFNEELTLLTQIRESFSKNDVEIRVDANGAFTVENALNQLKKLAEFDLHSIEQPIMPKQWEDMANLCASTPLPIALDEELIGINGKDKIKLLDNIKPQYVIFKPSLLGGFKASEEWLKLADEREIGWWVTSALESNIGLNSISQWVYTLKNPMPQGLGTGQLFTNNFDSPLQLKGQQLWFNNQQLNSIQFPSFL